MMVVKKVMAASLTIVMLTDLAGDEIWTEAAGGACGIFGWWTTQNLLLKPVGNNNNHTFVITVRSNVITSSLELRARQLKLSRT